MLEPITVHCPYCGEPFESAVDTSVEEQTYVEDCAVCCRPIVVTASAAGGELLALRTTREHD